MYFTVILACTAIYAYIKCVIDTTHAYAYLLPGAYFQHPLAYRDRLSRAQQHSDQMGVSLHKTQ